MKSYYFILQSSPGSKSKSRKSSPSPRRSGDSMPSVTPKSSYSGSKSSRRSTSPTRSRHSNSPATSSFHAKGYSDGDTNYAIAPGTSSPRQKISGHRVATSDDVSRLSVKPVPSVRRSKQSQVSPRPSLVATTSFPSARRSSIDQRMSSHEVGAMVSNQKSAQVNHF